MQKNQANPINISVCSARY